VESGYTCVWMCVCEKDRVCECILTTYPARKEVGVCVKVCVSARVDM